MIPVVCQAIVQVFKHEVFNQLVTPEALNALAGQFEQRQNIPHAVWGLDGKHIAITKPPQMAVCTLTTRVSFRYHFLRWWRQITSSFGSSLVEMDTYPMRRYLANQSYSTN